MEFKKKVRIKPDLKPESESKPETESPVDNIEVDDKTFKVNVISDFRKFKKGDIFDFTLPVTVIVGDNGSGKSSLIHAIRGKHTSKKSMDSLFNDEYIKLSKNIQILTGIKKFFFLDSIKDDGTNMNNSFDASAFVTNGGFHTQSLSHGEKQLYYINKLISKIEKFRKTSDEKFMLILDEFDKGFSLTNQARVINILYNVSRKFNCRIICISHNYLLINKISVVYDIDKKDYVLSKDYLANFN